MQLYQNKISNIKYFNYDDTIKTKKMPWSVPKKQLSKCLNYYALKIIWNNGCATAHQLKRRFKCECTERRILCYYKG